jgi:hypothetical protein
LPEDLHRETIALIRPGTSLPQLGEQKVGLEVSTGESARAGVDPEVGNKARRHCPRPSLEHLSKVHKQSRGLGKSAAIDRSDIGRAGFEDEALSDQGFDEVFGVRRKTLAGQRLSGQFVDLAFAKGSVDEAPLEGSEFSQFNCC